MSINTGVLWRDPQPQDDIAGDSRVVYEVRVPDGQHDSYVPTDNEEQAGLYGDTYTCTNNSCSNSIDTQCNWHLKNGKISSENIKLLTNAGFIVNGQFNTSERFNAIMSGTDRKIGNYLYKPWDSARNDGMIPESMLPYPNRQRTPVFTVDDYYDSMPISDEMKRVAKEVFLKVFNIQYEIVPTDRASMQFHFKHAPLSIISGCCPGWNTDKPIQACPIKSGHATMLYGEKDQEYLKDFDSYIPNQKQFAWDYIVSYAIKGVVTMRDDLTKFKHLFLQELKVGDANDEVKNLQIALFLEGVLQDSSWPTRELVQKFGGFFGWNTQRAVMRLQAKHHIPQTGLVGPITNDKLNSLFS